MIQGSQIERLISPLIWASTSVPRLSSSTKYYQTGPRSSFYLSNAQTPFTCYACHDITPEMRFFDLERRRNALSHPFPPRHISPSPLLPILLILHLPPIPLHWLIPTRLLNRRPKRRLPSIQLPTTGTRPSFQSLANSNGLIAPEALPHIYHATLALAVACFELLAFGGHRVEEGRAEAV